MYAHLPLLHGPDGKKLSKRHGAASVQELREDGYLPEAVRNYIALLGWGYDETTTFFTTDELVERFALERVSKNPAVFDEQKLRWMNGRYMRELPRRGPARAGSRSFYGRDDSRSRSSRSRQEKMQTLADFWPLAGFLVEAPADYDEKAWRKVMGGGREHLRAARDALADASRSTRRRSRRRSARVVDELEVKPKEVFQPVRVAITRHDRVAGHLRVGRRARAETRRWQALDEALRKARIRAAPKRKRPQPFVHPCRYAG